MARQCPAARQPNPNFLSQIAVLKFFTLQLSIIFAAVCPAIRQPATPVTGAWQPATISGSVFQWIEFQIPILKMQVRFLPGLLKQQQTNSKPPNSY
jgi:hypothetical protein